MAILLRLKSLFRRDLTPAEFEPIALSILADGQPRNVYRIVRAVERKTGKSLQGSIVTSYLTRLEEEGRIDSTWSPGGASPGRVYRLRS